MTLRNRRILGLAMVFALFGVIADPVQARNSLEFEGFRENVSDIVGALKSYCRENPGELAFYPATNAINDPVFVEACGKGLRGSKLPFGDWNILYDGADYPDGHKAIFGVEKRFELDGQSYLLAIGHERTVRFEGQQGEEIYQKPAALLNRRDQTTGTWREVINYVAINGRGWNVRGNSLSDFGSAIGLDDDNVHAIWQRVVAADFGKLVRNMHDMNWPQ
ncbi:hypothetical protein LPB41_22690 [Thalassospira sp. MA62]|nr:hypothetical protein [Thalassospira sp. MA62]